MRALWARQPLWVAAPTGAAPPDAQRGRYIVKYTLIAGYGLWSALVGVPTIRAVSGEIVESIWPWAIVVAAAVAIVGVIRSRSTGRAGTEVLGILLLLAVLAGYAITIYTRCVTEGTWDRAPTGVLPIVVMVMPFARMLDLSRRRGKAT